VRNVTSCSMTLILAAALALPARDAQAQTRFVASVGAGSLFDGVGFGFGGGALAPGSMFFGLSLGLNWAHSYGSPYGIYSDTYDGWQRGYRGHPGYGYGYGNASCWDSYWDPYWDPWDGDCVAFAPMWGTPWGYPAYRPWRFGFGFGFGFSSWYGPTLSVYMADPFATPWGPYWSYDPWAGYWNTWGARAGWGRGYYGYGGTRVVYAGGRHGGWGVYRPSPLVRHGPTYVENPTGGNTGRTAHRRGTTTTAAVPAPTRDPRAPVVQGNPLGVPGWGDPGTVRGDAGPRSGVSGSGTSGRVAQPRGATRSPTSGGRIADPRTGAPRVAVPSGNGRPSGRAVPATSGRPPGRAAPSGNGRPSGRAVPATSGRPSGRAAPSGNARPSGRAPAAVGRTSGGSARSVGGWAFATGTPSVSGRPSGGAPAARPAARIRRPTDRLPRSERVGRAPVRGVPGSAGYGRSIPAGSSRAGSTTPSSRFSTGSSRVGEPQARPRVRSAPRNQPSPGTWQRSRPSGTRSVAPRATRPTPTRATRPAPTRATPSRGWAPRPSPSPRSRAGSAAPRVRAPRASAPRRSSGGSVSRAAPRRGRHGGG